MFYFTSDPKLAAFVDGTVPWLVISKRYSDELNMWTILVLGPDSSLQWRPWNYGFTTWIRRVVDPMAGGFGATCLKSTA